MLGKSSYKLIVAEGEYVRFARKMVIASIVALLIGIAAAVYAAVKRC